jgi:magnesium chelatase subunit I
MAKPRTLGELKAAGYSPRSVKDDPAQSDPKAKHSRGTSFPGIVGYDDSVIPQIINALLAGTT